MSNDELNRRAAECLGYRKSIHGYQDAAGEVVYNWHPCQSRDQAALLEAEIWKLERQARWDYRNALYREWVSSEDSENFDFWLITAPAEARVKACLAVLEENQPAEGKSE